MLDADPLFANVLETFLPGKALDLACGSGRHAIWLAKRGWAVTAVDQCPGPLPEEIVVITANLITAKLETPEYLIETTKWDLIVCWLYWQADLLPSIAAGLVRGGVAAMSGKTTGRFATSLANYRRAFPGWQELAAGEDTARAWLIVRKP